MTTRNQRVRFLNNNFAASSGTTLTASSEQTGFEIENAVDPQRFRLWSPSGSFTIDSTNNKIYINDGSNKTVTLTSATYTTPTLMAAHIQTQLNASSSNWTCTYSTTTYKFTIGRSGGTRTLRFSQTTGAAWSTLGYTGSGDTTTGVGLAADEVRIHTDEWVHVDLGFAREVTAFIFIGAAGEAFTVTSTVTVMASNTDNFSSPDLTVTVTPDRDGAYRMLDDQAGTTYRYWKIKWSDPTNIEITSTGFRINQFYLGDYVSPTTRNVNTGFKPTLVDPSAVSVSENGGMFFRRFTKYWMLENLVIQYLESTDRTDLCDMYEDLGKTTPFFIVLDPLEAISSRVGEFIKYVVFTNWETDQFIFDQFTLSFSCREVI